MFKKLAKSRQEGFVSIIAAALIMVILSLITIGFTRVMQREQRQALDRQLSRQAVYAAESGINDVNAALKANINLPTEKLDCDVEGDVGGQPNPAVNGGIIDIKGLVGYTCVLYDKTPSELVYALGTNDSKIVELKAENALPLKTLKIRWSNEQGNNSVVSLPACGPDADKFPASRGGNVPLIRLDLTDASTLSRANLINGTDYLYLSPCNNGSGVPVTSYSYSPNKAKGRIVQVVCSESQSVPCELNIDGLSSVSYIARLSAVYDSAKVLISGKDSSDETIEFVNVQTSIDVTGRANDVLRRLRVAAPFAEIDGSPDATFQSFDGICKMLLVDTDDSTVEDECI